MQNHPQFGVRIEIDFGSGSLPGILGNFDVFVYSVAGPEEHWPEFLVLNNNSVVQLYFHHEFYTWKKKQITKMYKYVENYLVR